MMRDCDCVTFLQAVLPRLGLRWRGFRRVRRQVCKRLQRRLQALDLPDLAAYRVYLDTNAAEWTVLDGLCRISISRFYRDGAVFDRLGAVVLPHLAEGAQAQGRTTLHCWSIGCASGEEPYTLSLLWRLGVQPQFPNLSCRTLATDTSPHLLARAARGCYPASSLRELPAGWREVAFDPQEGDYCLRPQFREGVDFRQQDIRTVLPDGCFDVVLCRNLVFTYFDEAGQEAVLASICKQLRSGGVLVIGKQERLPDDPQSLAVWDEQLGIYRQR